MLLLALVLVAVAAPSEPCEPEASGAPLGELGARVEAFAHQPLRGRPLGDVTRDAAALICELEGVVGADPALASLALLAEAQVYDALLARWQAEPLPRLCYGGPEQRELAAMAVEDRLYVLRSSAAEARDRASRIGHLTPSAPPRPASPSRPGEPAGAPATPP